LSTQTPSLSPPRLLPPRWWWLALIVILLCAGALRYTGYNFSLPYVDHVDEPHFDVAAQMIIDMGTDKSMNYQGYPPGLITVNYLFLRFFHTPGTPPTTIIWMVRLLSISASLVLLIVIGLLAYLLSTPGGGLLAALLWGFNPIAIEYARYATADTFVALFTVLAIYLVVTGVVHRREGWITAGILANLVGILFKYQSGFVLPLLILLSLAPLRAPDADRCRILEGFIRRMLIVGAFSFWLVLIYPSLEANQIANWVAPTDRMHLPSPEQLVQGILLLVTTNARGILLAVAALAGILLRRTNLWRIGVVAAALLLWLAGVGLFGGYDMRQVIGALAMLTVLLGVGLAGWIDLLARFRLPRWVFEVAVVAATLVLLVPDIHAALSDAYQRTLPDRRNDLARWMDVSVPAGSYIAPVDNHKTFNPGWGGYAGFTAFPYSGQATLTQQSLPQLRTSGVSYAIISNSDYQTLDPDVAKQLLLLKDYPPSSAYRGPDMAVLRLTPIQHAASGTLGSIRLVGYDLDSATVKPGGTIHLTYYWQADAPTAQPYVVFNHLMNASGDLVAQIDGDPLSDLRRSTTDWNDPQETLISRTFTLSIPVDTKSGAVSLYTGFYSRTDGDRLHTPIGTDQLLVTTLQISG